MATKFRFDVVIDGRVISKLTNVDKEWHLVLVKPNSAWTPAEHVGTWQAYFEGWTGNYDVAVKKASQASGTRKERGAVVHGPQETKIVRAIKVVL